MQRNLYLIILTFCLTSCYTYQVKKQSEVPADPKQESKNGTTMSRNINARMNTAEPAAVNTSTAQAPVPVNVQEKLKPGKNFKINVDGRSYKIIVDKWESDSLVAHAVHQPKKTFKFHKNQINSEKIAEKRFSQPIADILTVVAYAGIAVAIYSLVH